MNRGEVLLRAAEPGDEPAVQELLTGLELPLAGVNEWLRHFWVAETEGRIVGVAGVELYDDGALLRSVAVAPDRRSSGLGRALVDCAIGDARAAGAREVYLLTTTAENYFPRLGFEGVPRDQVPAGVQSSIEFREACPASAVVMRRAL